MRWFITLFVLLVFASPALFTAEQQPVGAAATSAEPFKLGTFEVDGEPRVGLVLQDKYVVELLAANRLLETNQAETAPAPGTGSYLPPVSTYRKPTP